MYCIVIAWVDMDGLKPTGEYCRPDGVNWQKEFVTVPRAHAVIWLNQGGPSDVQGALEYAAGKEMADYPLVQVYKFSVDVEDPLGDARKLILEEYQKVR